MQLTGDEIKLIVASLEMMQRLIRDDSGVSKSERRKVERVATEIKRKFHNAIFTKGSAIILPERAVNDDSILTPDGAINPTGKTPENPYK